MTNETKLTIENHLERDGRLDGWSADGLGPCSRPTEFWVKCFLSVEPKVELPLHLRNMFSRAQACMVYGCYHYPLFALGSEELFRFGESAMRAALDEYECSKTILKKSYRELQRWAHENGLIDDAAFQRWSASRDLRNSTSHKNREFLHSPNFALSSLHITVELTEALFNTCRSRNQLRP